MQNVEALREVKRAEAELRELKESTARQAGEVLRNAERQATALVEKAKADADAASTAALGRAHDEASKERARVMKSADADAGALRTKASGGDLQKAVDLIIKNFEARVAGK